MTKPEIKKLLEDLGQTQYGHALAVYLGDEMARIQNVQEATSWDDVLARKHVVDIIDKLFSFMGEKKAVKKTSQYD